MHLSFKHHKKVYTNSDRDSLLRHVFDNPYLDWLLIILASFILGAACIGIGAQKYFTIQDRLETSSTQIVTDRVRSFDVEALSRALKQIDDRSAERTTVLKGYVGTGDPSL